MISLLVVSTASLITAGLTLYSGFGLGTLLMPVFALFFPVEMAVAATAVVHGAHSMFKMAAVGRHADRALVLRFGIPAIIAAFAGAAALGFVAHFGELARYSLGPRTAIVTPIKLVMAALMLVFALFELLPRLRDLKFDRRHLVLGGLLSGFFGGFSGHQGALRSAFLVKTGISTEAFVGTSAAIGFLVDMARIATYAVVFLAAKTAAPTGPDQWPLILGATLSAFAGVMIAKRYLHKITMKTVQTLTGILLFGIALALGSGIV
ncbi:MAG: TSUP family transporter [Desulfobulbaceae bacterium]|jgi:uncharacterized membrane protein YfcA|nr:TSUP family transporter [Desulfobulbaceae bacterium]MDY0350706.1 TSUP family transporter [Desulfobulbaceae bacterium]